MARVAAACMIGAKSVATTNIVRRIPSIRTSDRSSYSARSSAPLCGGHPRAAADKCTDAGSVECSATSAEVIAQRIGLAARSSSWRCTSRAAALFAAHFQHVRILPPASDNFVSGVSGVIRCVGHEDRRRAKL